MPPDEETTRPDTLQAILNECVLTRQAAQTSANASLETRAEVSGWSKRFVALESRVSRLEGLFGFVPVAALAIAIAAFAVAAFR
jgi:hypothetical protein